MDRPSDNFIELTAPFKEEGQATVAPCYVDVLSILAILPFPGVAGSVLYMQGGKEIFVKESPAEVRAKIEAHWKG